MSFFDAIKQIRNPAHIATPASSRAEALSMLDSVQRELSSYTEQPTIREQRLEFLRGELPKSPILGAGLILSPDVESSFEFGSTDVSSVGYGSLGGLLGAGIGWELGGGSALAIGGGAAAGFLLVAGIVYLTTKD